MHGPREVLNELKWREGRDLANAAIWYIHRGAPGDTRIVPGSAVERLGTSFMEIQAPRERATGGHASIPYHRIYRIDYEGETLWERRGHEAPRWEEPAPVPDDAGTHPATEQNP